MIVVGLWSATCSLDFPGSWPLDLGLGSLTLDSFQRTLLIVGVEVAQGLANHQTQFNLIVQADALGAQDRSRAGGEDGGRRLEEEERLLGSCVV